MSRAGTLKKYLLITKILESNPLHYPPLETLQNYLESHGFDNISFRTLSRDFQILREEFGISIDYDKQKKGYRILNNIDEDIGDYRQFLKLLELAERVETIVQSIKSASYASRCIVFEHNDFFLGSEHLPILAEAIQHKILISFTYQSYQKEQPEKYSIAPCQVREYRNRWYLLGYDEQAEKIKIFGLDRMQQIELLKPFSEDSLTFDPQDLFHNTFGITCLQEPPSEVILSFTPQQGKYIKSLPLHHSQQVLEDNEKELRISLTVVLNIDLKMQLLSYGSSVEVLEPLALRQEIAEEYKKSLKKYFRTPKFGEEGNV